MPIGVDDSQDQWTLSAAERAAVAAKSVSNRLSGSHNVAGPLFGWLFLLVAPQYVRLGHVMVMWLLLAFTVEHIYVAALLDIKERSGLFSSIVTGYMGHERHSGGDRDRRFR